MKKNTTSILLKFSIVITPLSLVLFFINELKKDTWIAICITSICYFVTFVLSMIRLIKEENNPINLKRAVIFLLSYTLVIIVCGVIKLIIFFNKTIHQTNINKNI